MPGRLAKSWRLIVVVGVSATTALVAYLGWHNWSRTAVAGDQTDRPATMGDLVAQLSADEQSLLAKFPPGPRQQFMAYSLYHITRPARSPEECEPFVREVLACKPRPSDLEVSDPAVADQFDQAQTSLLHMARSWVDYGPFESCELDWARAAARLAEHPDVQVRTNAATLLLVIDHGDPGTGLGADERLALDELLNHALVKQQAESLLALLEAESAGSRR